MKFLFSVFFVVVIVSFLTATIINVPDDQPTIQAGIDASVDGDTVLVQPGTYVENINYDGKNITVASLFLTTQDTTYISNTIIYGNQSGSVVTFESGEDATAVLTGFTITNGYEEEGGGIYCTDNSGPSLQNLIITGNHAILRGGGIYCDEGASPIMYDLTICNNFADVGGGIYCGYSSPSLTNVVISNNNASTFLYAMGGGIHCTESIITLENVIISNNNASAFYYAAGGGIHCTESIITLESVTISDNEAWYGGGIACQNSSNLIFNNIIITNNSATESGGGIYCDISSIYLNYCFFSDNSSINGGGIYFRNSSTVMENSEFTYNNAEYGGGIYDNNSNLDLDRCFFLNNYATNGGGIYCLNTNPVMNNIVIANNSSAHGGGVNLINNCQPLFTNITFVNNSATFDGGCILCGSDSSPSFLNCILWDNLPQEIYFGDYDLMNTVTISYTDIQGGEAGIVTNNNGTVNWLEGNIDENPLFVGTGEHPYSLSEDSPCIDAGIPDTTGLNLPPWDIIGNYRIWDGDGDEVAIIDMGAYEYGAPPYVDVDVNVIVQTPEVLLYQNFPNPFNPETTILFSIPNDSEIELNIYNIKGQKVKTLVDETLESGNHTVIWNGRDSNGNRVSSGIYLYKLKVNGKTEVVKKCLLLK